MKKHKSRRFGRWVPYAEYLLTLWWKAKRRQKINSVDRRCEGCGDRRRLQVHHLHYRTLWREKNSDLKALCEACHGKEHELDRDADRHLRAIALGGVL